MPGALSDASPPRAVVLLSGGLDSATVLAMARRAGQPCYAMSFDYGQRQRSELAAARALAAHYACVEHRVVTIDLAAFGGSALTTAAPVPKGRASAAMGDGVPSTYVPARNTVFLAYALAWAEVLAAPELHIGVNAVDYSGYPDCRPAFVAAFTALANLGTAAADRGRPPYVVRAPLQALSKAEIIRAGVALGVDYGMTRSCYDPDDALACGACDACTLRAEGFARAGVPDPTHYR